MIGKIKTIRAFTLIELLMVISIISLLSSIVLGYVGSARAKSRDSVRLSDMQQINTAANMYRDDKNEVPDSIEMLVSTGYLSAVPKDPSTGISYSSKSISTSKGKVFIASTTYETIKREDGENQSVGVVVGDLTLADICIVLEATDSFPNCSEENPTDQIVGMTRGVRTGDGGETVVENGLVWSNIFGQSNWYDADTLCGSWGGRLPTRDELFIAIDNQFNKGINNPGGFESYPIQYWSLETEQYNNNYAPILDNYYIESGSVKPSDHYFRCVK